MIGTHGFFFRHVTSEPRIGLTHQISGHARKPIHRAPGSAHANEAASIAGRKKQDGGCHEDGGYRND
jgi:hypothetical protein